jgi:ribosomal protein S18 acetylase RimI-like enzyme
VPDEAASVEIRPLRDDERAAAGAVAGRALASNPTAYWTFGDDATARLRGNLDLFVAFVPTQPAPLGALLGDHVVGVCAASPPGACISAVVPEGFRDLPDEVGPPGDLSRLHFDWAMLVAHDLDERHWHVGPVSVEPGLQGTGVGGRLLAAFGEQMDDAGEVAWLETDKPENVAFYRRAGFEEAEQVTEHGLTTWWMRRDPRPAR